MHPIEKSKIKIGMKAKARFQLLNRLNQKGKFIFVDCTVIALATNYGRERYTVKLDQPLYDIVDKRTKEYEIANDEASVNNLYA